VEQNIGGAKQEKKLWAQFKFRSFWGEVGALWPRKRANEKLKKVKNFFLRFEKRCNSFA
jgi:hypothetical protein